MSDTLKPWVDLLIKQHQDGAPDEQIRLTARSIQGAVLREFVERWQPLIEAAKAMRSCYGLTGHSLYLMKSGVDMEKAIVAFDAAMAGAWRWNTEVPK